MKTLSLPAALLLIAVPGLTAGASDFPDGWTTSGGDWRLSREILPIIHQRSTTGTALAVCNRNGAKDNVWRAMLKPSQGSKETGLWIGEGEDLKKGLLVTLGRRSDVGGFALGETGGTALWQDAYAPWQPYHFYVVEAVFESQRMRVQMFEGDAGTLVSQSPWIPLAKPLAGDRRFGLFTRDGAARFSAPQRAGQPLSPIVPDPPNKRRLVQNADSPWLVVGPGNWMWTTGRKERLRQYTVCERTWAVHRGIVGAHRQWQCRLKVDPGTKGAGMLFQTNEEKTQGFIAWLGGKYGAGSLMLYQYEPEVRARWSGKSDSWHYNTEYLLRAETRGGQARVQLLQADGETVISESSWIDVGEQYAGKEGCLGFHVWSGRAEFWDFSKDTRGGHKPQKRTQKTAVQLGGGWQAYGDGDWQWADETRTRLKQRARPKQTLIFNTQIAGSQGTWRCRMRATQGTTAAGLVFQSSPDRKRGYVCLLTAKGARLETLDGKTLWEAPKWKWQPATEYVVEGVVSTDRVAARVLSADGKKVLTASPDIYVPESNNTRRGHLGLTVRGGQAEFWAWEKK